MFYSTEVLKSTRSALGFVWGAAHGRRLARTKVLQANISEACESILIRRFHKLFGCRHLDKWDCTFAQEKSQLS
eukprot:jgi/Picre1/31282/NNA_006635.t1